MPRRASTPASTSRSAELSGIKLRRSEKKVAGCRALPRGQALPGGRSSLFLPSKRGIVRLRSAADSYDPSLALLPPPPQPPPPAQILNEANHSDHVRFKASQAPPVVWAAAGGTACLRVEAAPHPPGPGASTTLLSCPLPPTHLADHEPRQAWQGAGAHRHGAPQALHPGGWVGAASRGWEGGRGGGVKQAAPTAQALALSLPSRRRCPKLPTLPLPPPAHAHAPPLQVNAALSDAPPDVFKLDYSLKQARCGSACVTAGAPVHPWRRRVAGLLGSPAVVQRWLPCHRSWQPIPHARMPPPRPPPLTRVAPAAVPAVIDPSRTWSRR